MNRKTTRPLERNSGVLCWRGVGVQLGTERDGTIDRYPTGGRPVGHVLLSSTLPCPRKIIVGRKSPTKNVPYEVRMTKQLDTQERFVMDGG